jgi:hypothetical protein
MSMIDDISQRIAQFIEPFRVNPGSGAAGESTGNRSNGDAALTPAETPAEPEG